MREIAALASGCGRVRRRALVAVNRHRAEQIIDRHLWEKRITNRESRRNGQFSRASTNPIRRGVRGLASGFSRRRVYVIVAKAATGDFCRQVRVFGCQGVTPLTFCIYVSNTMLILRKYGN